MTDPFETFSIPARPWLDPVDLQTRFHELAAAHHPDAHPVQEPVSHTEAPIPTQPGGTSNWSQHSGSNGQNAGLSAHTKTLEDTKQSERFFSEINEAHKSLRDPVSRLHHLLNKEAPEELAATKNGSISVPMSDHFLQVATILREITAFRAQQSLSLSPVTRAVLRSEHLSLRRDLDRTLSRMDELWHQCEQQIQAADAVWDRRTPGIMKQLAMIQKEMTYLQKWRIQLREARLLMTE